MVAVPTAATAPPDERSQASDMHVVWPSKVPVSQVGMTATGSMPPLERLAT